MFGFIVYDIYLRIPQDGAKVLNHYINLTYPYYYCNIIPEHSKSSFII